MINLIMMHLIMIRIRRLFAPVSYIKNLTYVHEATCFTVQCSIFAELSLSVDLILN